MLAARDAVTKAIEEARNEKLINKSQEAEVVVRAPEALCETASTFDASVFEELFIVARVTFEPNGTEDEITATVVKTELPKCPRCWNHRELGGNANHNDVCERCGDVLDALGA